MKKRSVTSPYRPIALLIVLCVLISTACFAQNKVDSIPFHYDAKLIVFKGKINNIDTDFAFDTGASMSVLPTDIAASAKVNDGRSRLVKDSNKKQKSMSTAKIDNLSIGSYNFKNTSTIVYDNPFLDCYGYFLLGADIINQLNWKIDFEKKMIYISNNKFDKGEAEVTAKVKFKNERHYTNLKINGEQFSDCLIDFGYVGQFEVSDNNAIFTKIQQSKTIENKTLQGERYNVGLSSDRTSPITAFIIEKLTFGDFNFPNLKVELKPATSNKIGLQFFTEQCSFVIINSSEKAYYLKYLKPSTNDLGFSIDCQLKDKKLIIVGKIGNVESATNSLKTGEAIQSINGKKASDFENECAFRKWKLLLNEKGEYTLVTSTEDTILVRRQFLQ